MSKTALSKRTNLTTAIALQISKRTDPIKDNVGVGVGLKWLRHTLGRLHPHIGVPASS